MASPLDVNAALDAIVTAAELHDLGYMTAEDFTELRLALLQIARKYAAICLQGKLRVEDIE